MNRIAAQLNLELGLVDVASAAHQQLLDYLDITDGEYRMAKKPPTKSPETPKPGKATKAVETPVTLKAATVTLKQLAPDLAETAELSKKQAETVLNTLVEMVTARLKAGDKVRLTGLGILQVRDRPARTGRNPATGQPIEIKASKKVAFSVAKELKDVI